VHPRQRGNAFVCLVFAVAATLVVAARILVFAQALPSTTPTPSAARHFRIPPAPAINQLSHRTYTPSSDGRITVRNVDSGNTIDQITAAGHAVDVVVNPSTDLVYALSSNGVVSIIDGATDSVGSTITLGQSAYAIGINTITSRLYVGTVTGLFVVDGRSRRIVASLPGVFADPDIAVNEATNRVYASSIDEGRVNVIDGFATKLVAKIGVGSRPAGLAVDPLANRIYVANSATATKGPGTGDTITVIDGYKNAPVSTLRVGREGVVGVDFANTSRSLSLTMSTGAPILLALSPEATGPPISTALEVDSIPLQASATFSLPNATQATSLPGAGAYNIRIATDASPDLTDVQSLINSATSLWTTPAEKVWALFYWSHILKRQTGPVLLHGFEVTDPIRNFTDFGFTMCSTASGINQSLFELIGLRHQYWDICNHTVSAVEYDGAFHMVDTSMSNLVTTDDGVTLASVTQVAANSARLLRERSLYVTSPNGYLTGGDSIRNLPDIADPTTGAIVNGFYRDFCETGLKYRDYYYNWDRGHRYVLNLRENETYTRYFSRLGTTSDYWISSEKIGAADPANTFQNDASNRFGLRGNGKWSFVPDLTSSGWSNAVYQSTGIMPASTGGLTSSVPGTTAELVYKVQAGNAITSQHVQAQFLRSDAVATATISISINHGNTWTPVGTAGASLGNVPLIIDLRNEVNGAYETLVKIQMVTTTDVPEGISLIGLGIDTITQVNVKALPRLNIGRNEVYIGAGGSSDTMVLWPDLRGTLWQKDVFDSTNIATQSIPTPRTYTAILYPSVLTRDAYLTYRLQAPTDITKLVYGGRMFNYGPGSYIDFLHSFDNGATWTRSYRFTDVSKPYDVIHFETVSNIPAGVRTVLFKFLMHNTGPNASHATGFYSLRMEADHQPVVAAMAPIDVTFNWKELKADRTTVARSHKQIVTEFPFKYIINVGGADHPILTSITTSLDSAGDGSPSGYGDGVDAGGTKFLYRKRLEGTNLAINRPYTFSRTPSGFQQSAPATNTTILTNGVVGSPITGGISYWQTQCWTDNTPVDLQVDLGAPMSVGAARAHLLGYPGLDALKGQVKDTVEVLTSLDGTSFASQGFLQTGLWRKDVPINYMLQDDETSSAWNFELDLPTPAVARYVRYHVTPKRILCASELQVFDRIDYAPFDVRIAPPADIVGTPPNDPPTVSLTSPADQTQYTAPASIRLTANASDSDGGIQQVDFFSGGTLIGSATSAPYTFTWTNVDAGTYTLTARALDTAGAMTSSSAVSVIVNPGIVNVPPTVSLTAPADQTQYTAPTSIALTADASDADGGIQRVDFFAGTTLIGSSAAAPYTLTWVNVGAGTYALTARALDAAGATTTSSPVTVIVNPATNNVPPSVAITAPLDEAAFTAPVSIHVTADASDSDNGIKQVDFFAGATPIGSAIAAPYTVTWSNVAPGRYTLTARALDNGGATTTSAGVDVTIDSPSTGLPAPWATQDIGAVGKAGDASFTSGTFSVTGGGADIWGTADALRYVYQPLNGDGQIVARVVTVQNTNAWVKAGVMIRGDLTPGAAQATMMVTPAKGNNFQRRPSAGATSLSTAGLMVTAPYWVKLTRVGTAISAYQSSDGVTWSQVGSQIMTMGTNVLVGLAVSAHSTTTLATATFDNVSIGPATGPGPAPSPWTTQDVGAVGRAGAATFDATTSTFSVSGAGADIWGTADAFRYVDQPLVGDGEIVARVVSVQNTNAWVKAGVMVRADLTPGSAQATMMVTPGKGNNFQRRQTTGGSSVGTAGLMVTAPYWVKLTRVGSTVTAYQSANGVSWSLVGTDTINLPSSVLIGIVVSSHSTSTLATATFDSVTVTGGQ